MDNAPYIVFKSSITEWWSLIVDIFGVVITAILTILIICQNARLNKKQQKKY